MAWRAAAAAVAVVAVVAAAALFEPWRLFTSSRVDEALPTVAPSATAPAADEPATGPGGTDEPAAPARPPDPVELARGRFVDAEHGTTGTVRVIELADGRRFVRLEDLATSDGPDLHVWLSDRPSGGAWDSYDDGRFVRLGDLTATHGNQNYQLPADAEIAGMTSVVIWCDRFDVAFGTAPVDLRRA
jgi:hypothetical protein